ncbi:hypothetical protein VP02_18920 [Pseudomonas ogarae]|uniref:Uncharacterized protein n=1 Tax=Pseudomonas kilonensis TaxID=132476 RepID=A0A0F4XLL8_9PSED|nr:hypothetical protein [Pseudomonas ogarae]KKA06223.1 hypothetical protein VP02_18920 [Pseudomonas ogarae]
MQDVDGSMRSHWASGMGWIIYSLNEVDMMLVQVYGIITQQEMPITLPAKWHKSTTAERLKIVETELDKIPESPATLRIKRIFDRAKVIMDKRNHIAHGVLVLAGTGAGEMQMLRYDKKTDQMLVMTYSELQETEKLARKLSDDLSLLISLCKLYEDFIKPYAPDEIQGGEQIRPYDPSPAV